MLSRRAVAGHNGLLRSTSLHQVGTRSLQTTSVTDADIARLTAKPLHPLTLADLCTHGRPPLSTDALLNSANFTLRILPSRLAHRIQSLRSLPYIVVANPSVNKIHSNYVHSLSTLLPYAEKKIDCFEEEVKFTEVMADLVQTHSNTISTLARGFLEARKYITAKEVTAFLDEHLRARIGTRLIAEQHIALHLSSKPHNRFLEQEGRPSTSTPTDSSFIGVIDTSLRPASIIRACEATVGEICELKYGVRPTVNIIGSPDATIAHIPMHLEYILTELLKNSFRAIIEAGMEQEPVEITIAPSPVPAANTAALKAEANRGNNHRAHAVPGLTNLDQGFIDHASGTASAGTSEIHSTETGNATTTASANIRPLDQGTPGVTIRIRDRGGGISPENYSKLWNYGFTTFNEDEINDKTSSGNSALDGISAGAGFTSSLAGLGYGLPLGRAYAEYFGGGIAVQSLWGWGTDIYLSLRGVGKI